MDEEVKVTDVVILKQLPVIEERLAVLRDEITAKVDSALSMECTEDTVKEIKKVRASLKKDATDFETKRKDIKKKILEPYEQFEAVYKQYIGNLYQDADRELAGRINQVEDSLKGEKKDELIRYFDELKEANGLADEEITLEDSGVNITLSASMKSLKDAVKAFVERVRDELSAIAKDANAEEVLVEYRKTLNLSSALLIVSERHRQIDEIKRKSDGEAKEREDEAAKVAEIDALILEEQAKDNGEDDAFAAPVVEEIADTSDVYEVCFRVSGTIEQIKALKTFLVDNGFDYEQIELV